MSEIYKDTSERVYLTINVGTTQLDADGTVTAVLTDKSKGVQIYEGEAINDPTQEGRYYTDIPVSATNADKKLELVWKFYLDGQSVTKTDHISVVTPYVTINELIEEFPELADRDYNELKRMERRARLIINSYTGQSFGRWWGTETVRGTGGRELYTSTPVISIESVSGVSARWDEDGWPIMPNSPIVAPLSDTYEIKFDGSLHTGIFYDGRKYTMTGWFGWDDVPEEITEAAKMLIWDMTCKDSIYRQKGIDAVTSSDWRLDFNAAALAGTGNLDVDRLLSPFVVTRLMII